MKRITAAIALAFIIAGAALGAGETSTMQAWVNSINTWVTSAKASLASLSSSLSALTTRVAAVETVNGAQTTRLTADETAIATQAGQIATLQAQVATLTGAPAPTPTPTPTPAPTADPQVQWRAGMESGTLAEWDEKVNSGSADTTVVSAASVGIAAHGGSYVMQQAVTGTSGGTRMHRYAEVDALTRAGTKYYWSWWDYFPAPLNFPAQNTWIIWGLESVKSAGVAPDPFYALVFHDTGNTLDLVFNPSGLTVGLPPKVVYSSNIPVPVGQWNFFEIEILPRGDLTGSIQVWMNKQLLLSLTSVLTCWPFVGQTLVGLIEQTGYGDVTFAHYVDDVTLSLGRMP